MFLNAFVSVLLFSILLVAQDKELRVSTASIQKNTVFLPSDFVVLPRSIVVHADARLLEAFTDWEFMPRDKSIVLKITLGGVDSIRVNYRVAPLLSTYQNYTMPPISPRKARVDSQQMPRKRLAIKSADEPSYFDSMNKSGAIYRGFKVGTGNDLNIESGMNITLDGQISDNLHLQAALRDENIPIQPEGTTERLSDIDRIYIKISSEETETVIGDYNLNMHGNNLFAYNRRLKGAMFTYDNSKTRALGSISSSRARFHNMQLLTRNGLQGPYQLVGEDNSHDIVVIAGSERVFLDGEELRRGKNRDYVMEYATGTISFTTKRLLRANQRLEIDFEYVSSAQRFGRQINVGEVLYRNDDFSFKTRFIHEADDPESPLAGFDAYSRDERAVLSAAGADENKASVSGIRKADGMRGLYDKIYDATHQDTVLVYNASAEGAFDVTFSRVGANKGSYERVSRVLNQFRHVGRNKGEYAPVIRLRIPETKQLILNQLRYAYGANNSLSLDYALSNHDRNSLSSKDDASSGGNYLTLNHNLNEDKLFGLRDVRLRQDVRFYDRRFTSVNRFYDADFYSKWGLEPLASRNDRFAFEQDASFRVAKRHESSLRFSTLREGEDVQAISMGAAHAIEFESDMPTISAAGDGLENSQKEANTDVSRRRFSLSAGKKYDTFSYNAEVKTDNYKRTSPEKHVGFRKTISRTNSTYKTSEKHTLSYEVNALNHLVFDSLQNRQRDFSSEIEHQIRSFYKSRKFQSKTTLAFRNREIAPFFLDLPSADRLRYVDIAYSDTSFTSQESFLIEQQLTYHGEAAKINLTYGARNELAPFREYVYQQVNTGFGNFRLDSVANQYVRDDIRGNFLRYTIPNGRFLPVTTLRADLSLNYQPQNSESAFIRRNLRRLQFKSELRVTERNQSRNTFKSYILTPSRVQSSKTISGSARYAQYVYFDRENSAHNYVASYVHQSSLRQDIIDAFSTANASNIANTFGIEQHYSLSSRVNHNLLVEFERIRIANTSRSELSRNIMGYSMRETLRYFPSNPVTLSLISSFRDQTDRKPEFPIHVRSADVTLSGNYSFGQLGFANFSASVTHVDVVENKGKLYIPNEMSNGKKEGNNYTWSANASYVVGENISLNLNYNGRKHVIDDEPFHLFRMEVRLTL